MARPARPEPKVFLPDEPVDADAYRPEFFGHAGDGDLLGEKSTSYLECPTRPTGWPRRSARRRSWSSCATRSPARSPTGASAATTASRTGRWPRRCAPTSTARAPWDPERVVGLAVRLCRARPLRRRPRPLARPVPAVHVQFLEELLDRARADRRALRLAGRRRRRPARRRASPVNASSDGDRRARRRAGGAAARPLPPRQRPPALGRSCPAATCRGRRKDSMTRRHPVQPARGRPAASSTTSRESIESGHTSSGGPFSERAGALLQEATGAQEVLLTTSCTDRARAERDAARPRARATRSIVPSFTFTSSALAFARQGARILFCDIEPETLGPRPGATSPSCSTTPCARSSSSTTPASPATSAGVREALADRPDVVVVEDAAHGLFGALARASRSASLGRLRQPDLPRDQELRLRRGRRAAAQRPGRRRPGAGPLRQGHRPAGVLPRPGRQVLLARHRLLLRPLRHARGATSLGQLEQAESIQARRRPSSRGTSSALAGPAAELGLRLPGRARGLRPGLAPVPRAAARRRDAAAR